MDLDDVLPDVGAFGVYQKCLLYLVLLPAVLPCAFHAYSQLFMAARPIHWCKVPELQNWTLSESLKKSISIPLEPRDNLIQYSECLVFVRNYTDLLESWSAYNSTEDVIREASFIETRPTESCTSGWQYDRSQYIRTVVTEWDLVCEKDFYATFALVVFGAGGLIGNYIFGYLQDSLGRKPSFFLYLLICTIFGSASAFAQDFVTWTVCRTAVGFTVPAILASPYVLAIELVGPDKRSLCTVLSNIAYSLGLVLLSAVVYLIRDWRVLALATAAPFAFFFLYWFAMPESPRWLLARGRYDDAEAILRTMAKVNGKVLPANYMSKLKRKLNVDKNVPKITADKGIQYGIMDLFRTPNMRHKTMIITFIWFTNTSVYVGLSYYAPALGGNEFWNFFLAGIVELPTYLFLLPALEGIGRRWTLCVSMVVGGVACLATFLVQNQSNVTLGLYCVGKMGISSAFVVLPLAASELYPTVVRGLGMSISSVVGMLGPVFIPLINYLGSDMMVLPLMIMGGLLVLGGAGSLLLPETLGQPLPQTLADGEAVKLIKPWKVCRHHVKSYSQSTEINKHNRCLENLELQQTKLNS